MDENKIVKAENMDTNNNDEDVKKNPGLVTSVEEALNYTGFGKYNIGLLLVCSWTLQAMGMDLFGTSFVVAAAVCDLELDMQERALLIATPLAGVVAGAHLWGYIADTKGRRLTLTLSMSIGFVFAALSSLSPNWQTMMVLKLLSSTFTSASNASAYTLLGESCSARARGRAMLLGTCALMCAQALTAALAYPILPLGFSYPIEVLGINYRPWRLLGLVMSLPCAITAILLQFFHESPKFLVTRSRREEALKVLKSIYAWNTGKSADDFPVKVLIEDEEDKPSVAEGSFFKALWQQTVPLFRPPLLKNTLKLFYLVTIIYITGSGFLMWLPYVMNNLFLVVEKGGGAGMNLCTIIRHGSQALGSDNVTSTEICNDTIQETTLLSAMAYGACATSSTLLISLTCESRKRKAIMGILALSAAAAVLLNVVHVPIAGAAFFFIFLLVALAMGILSVYFVELYPTSVRGMASCLSVMLGRFTAFLGTNAIGALLQVNCEATFYVWAVLLLSAIVFAFLLPMDKAAKAVDAEQT